MAVGSGRMSPWRHPLTEQPKRHRLLVMSCVPSLLTSACFATASNMLSRRTPVTVLRLHKNYVLRDDTAWCDFDLTLTADDGTEIRDRIAFPSATIRTFLHSPSVHPLVQCVANAIGVSPRCLQTLIALSRSDV